MGAEGAGGNGRSCEVGGGGGDGDVRVITSDGRSFAVHSRVLMSASPVLERILYNQPRMRGSMRNAVPILGVPSNAVVVFLRCLYFPRCLDTAEMEKYGVHLLVLAHTMRIPWLKRAAEAALTRSLSSQNVADMLQVARLCDVPRLYVAGLNLVCREYEDVEETEGWRFIRCNDPWLELEVLKFIEDTDLRKKRWMKRTKDQQAYAELNEAMQCLEHICTVGCGIIKPCGDRPVDNKGSCRWGNACDHLQSLLHHLGSCTRERKENEQNDRRCQHCDHVRQLLRLHSAVCRNLDTCKVPLCGQLKKRTKKRTELAKGKEEGKWELLARKMISAKLAMTLSEKKRLVFAM